MTCTPKRTGVMKRGTSFLTVAPKMHSSLASRINSASEGIRRPLEPLVAHLCSVAPHQFGSTSGAHDGQHGEHRLHQHAVLPLAARTQFQVAGIALRGMEAGVA